MAIILSLETSTEVCSVALHQNGTLISSRILHQGQAHATHLALLIDEVFSESAVDKKNIQAIAVSIGPGSYTGLRIGVSTAKGLAYALSVPVLAINTLAIMTVAVMHEQFKTVLRCPMIDARRLEVYCQLFSPALKALNGVEARVIDENSFREVLDKEQVVFFGNGAMKCEPLIQHPNAFFLPGVFPSAENMGTLAVSKFNQGQTEDLFLLEPFYLKEFRIGKPATPLVG